MYFERKIDGVLESWYTARPRKPLVVSGARQTGKSTSIRNFGTRAPLYIELNLERFDDLMLTRNVASAEEFLQALRSRENLAELPSGTLLFIDEVQANPTVVQWLRFFFEDYPYLAVVVAGSYLGVRLKEAGFSFPVGRVTFRRMSPLSLLEFARATGRGVLAGEIEVAFGSLSPLAGALRVQANRLLADYVLVGGMPEAVSTFVLQGSVESVGQVHRDLRQALAEDIQKYPGDVRALERTFARLKEAYGLRYKYERLVPDQKGPKSRDAVALFDGAMLVHDVYPTSAIEAPMQPKARTAHKLIALDIGLAAAELGVSGEALKQNPVHEILGGRLSECFVGQQLLSDPTRSPERLHYWVRQKRKSDAEVDFLLSGKQGLLPVEVKSGATGRLRSLHQFLSRSHVRQAVRIHSGPLDDRDLDVNVGGQMISYRLTSLPLYMAELVVEWLRS